MKYIDMHCDTLEKAFFYDKDTVTSAPEMMIDVERLKKAGVSGQFFAMFMLPQTIKEYIRDRRLEEARVLLVTTNRSVQEISDELQIGSRSYFSVAFREKYGESPSDYRMKNLKL